MSRRLTRLPRFEPGSQDWHDQRALAVGGSEIAAVMGFSPWESRFSLWHRKKALVPQGIEDTEQLYWGRAHEATVAGRFAENHPEWKVRRTGTFAPADRPFQLVSPDRDIMLGRGDHLPLEIKTSRDDIGWGPAGTDEIPIYYRTQCIWQMDALQVARCHVAVLIAGSDYREYVVDRDESEAAMLLAAAEEFVGTLTRDERPDIDAHGATYDVIRTLHPDIDDRSVEVSLRVAGRFVQAREQYKAAEAEKDYATSLLADVMGNARRATFDGQTIASRQARKTGTPYLVAARELPYISTKAALAHAS